ncbi:MAG TPA: phosphate ABC transporter permease subunit PstC [Acidimicrobiia bacterium]|nr:phosphate ABC transporter permease subunit PstC [Acidimicrobiia bacterium]
MTAPTVSRRSSDVWGDRVFRAVALAAGLSVLAILALIAFVTTKQAWPIFRRDGFGFITGTKWDPTNGKFGALPFIYGTAVSSVIALVLAVPLSLGIALFTNELAPRRLRRPVIYAIDLLAAIPSVVYGLWALAVFERPAHTAYQWISDTIGRIPGLGRLFGGTPGGSGASFMTAGIVLAVMITPIVTAISREVLATVAQDDKNAAIAMGATRWEMLRMCVFPRARSGLTGAVMLGLGRALGETIAVALVIGSSHQITSHLFKPGDSMASVIAHEFPEGQSDPTHRAALIGLAVVLFAFTIVVNVAARWIANRTTEKAGAAP